MRITKKSQLYWLCTLIMIALLLVAPAAGEGAAEPAGSDDAQQNVTNELDTPGPVETSPTQEAAATEEPAAPEEEEESPLPDEGGSQSPPLEAEGGATGDEINATVTPTPTATAGDLLPEEDSGTPAGEGNTTEPVREDAVENTIAFVTNDSQRRAAITNVTGSVPLNVSLFSEEEAVLHDFSGNSLIFAASIGNETADRINGTAGENATVITYDLPEGMAFGVPADEILERYWLYGGETNLEQLLLLLDNRIYGANHDLADPVPPPGRPRIAYISSRTSEAAGMAAISRDPAIRSVLDISVYLGKPNEDLSFSLDGNDVILLIDLSASVVESIRDTVREARDNGSVVIAWGPIAQSYGLHTVDPSDPVMTEITEYLEYPSDTNFGNLARYIGVTYCGITADVAPPQERPVYGIYHPDAPRIFATPTEYLDWYTVSGRYDATRPTVGILTGAYKYMSRDGPMIDALVRSFEGEGANVIVATYHYSDPARSEYFLNSGEVLIDAAVLISKGSRLDYSDPERGIEYLQFLNVPVLNAIRLFSGYGVNETTWRNSPHGIGPDQTFQLLMAELDGIIEPIVFAGEPDTVTGDFYYKPFDDQVAWLTERTLGWASLHRTANAEKKIVIPYYSAEGGKATVGADIDYYLNAQASLASLLKAMQGRGYNLGTGPLPDKKELADLMATKGYNIGTWAQEELNRRVEAGDVILVPEDQYLTWFNELPAAKRQKMVDVWGEPPGEIMVYENGGTRSLVIPTIKFGNVLLVPDPVWGWNQNTSVMYHDGSIPPTHQCLAFYYYMDRVYQADAIFSIFSGIVLMPGKESGLAADDWGALLMGDMPHVHVLPIDAQGIADRRRANMAIVDFLTPTIVPAGLYGPLADLAETITNYRTVADEAVKAEYRSEIITTIGDLNLDTDLGTDLQTLESDEAAFDAFVGDLDEYLTELKTTFMPYGSHTLGEVPAGEQLVAMVDGMLGSSFAEHVAATGNGEEERLALLAEVLINGTPPGDAQTIHLLGVHAVITGDLNLALDYKNRIEGCTIEIPRILDALEAKYIPPGPNGDPVRNPDALPTGRNLHTFDDRIIPTKAAWTVGKRLGDDLLAAHVAAHGAYPDKAAFLLWSVETSRHQGTMEAEILHLLGARPVWNKYGRVDDVELIPSTELGRPRIDVLVVTSGFYRDMYASKLLLIDKAVRLAATADDGDTPNYVREHTAAIYQDLINKGYDAETARELAASRIFCPPPDSYTPGIEHAIGATDTWSNTEAIAELYINRMGHVYGSTIWGEQYADVFRENLGEVDTAVFSRTSNVYGTLEHPMVAAYFGGLNLAVKSVSGTSPDMYINNQRDAQNQKLETLQRFVSRDLRSRYLNPEWIGGMMDQGFDGARYMEAFVENMWIWDVTTPDLITGEMWDSVYETYAKDQYDLGLKEFFSAHNPYAHQSITARMLDAARKGYWSPEAEVLQHLAQEFQQSVELHGVTCCHHTCGNLQLDAYIQSRIPAPQAPDSGGSSDDTSGRTGKSPSSYSSASSALPTFTPIPSGTGGQATNTTDASGVGKVVDKVAGDMAKTAQEVTGHVMREVQDAAANPTTSTPIIPIILVLLVIGAISAGFWLKRR